MKVILSHDDVTQEKLPGLDVSIESSQEFYKHLLLLAINNNEVVSITYSSDKIEMTLMEIKSEVQEV